MLSQIGFFSLVITLILNFANILFLIIFNDKKKDLIFYYCIRFAFVTIIISFLSLMGSYLISDFSNYNVFQNSHSTKPLIYKISATWGNHEGSMLLWILVMNFYTFMFSFNKTLSTNTKKWTIIFQSILTVGFCLFVIFTSNPFLITSVEVKDGLGFNPILQDPAVAIHPPILYLGYVGFSLILSLALAGLVTNSVNLEWTKITKKWSIFSWSMLTGGIAIGSYWAYYELGWGGWWFWDPVENASLMPWLAGLALVHTLTIVDQNQLLKRWSIFLAILCFSLSLIGTFLVRSGIITSVHAFANDSSRGIFILILFLIITGFSFLLFIIKSPEKKYQLKLLFINKTTAIIINNIVMITACITVLLGTIYPIFVETFTNQRISVGTPYFNSTVIPIVLPGLLLMSIAPVLSWQTNKLNNAPVYLYMCIGIAIIVLIITYFTSSNLWGFIGLFIAFYVIISSLFIITKKLISLKSKNYKFFFINNNSLIAHLGVGILILGITVSSLYQKEYHEFIKVNDKIKIGKYSLLFNDINIIEKKNYQTLSGNFSLYNNQKLISKINPEKRYYKVEKIITTEAAIYHSFWQDFYLVLGDKNNNVWSIKLYQNPLVLLIWIGASIMIFAGLIGLRRK